MIYIINQQRKISALVLQSLLHCCIMEFLRQAGDLWLKAHAEVILKLHFLRYLINQPCFTQKCALSCFCHCSEVGKKVIK